MLAAIACLLLAMAFPTLLAALPTETYQLFTYGCHYCNAPIEGCEAYEVHTFAEHWQIGAGILHGLCLALMGLAVCSFKKRPLQIRLLALVNVLAFATLAVVIYAYAMLTGGQATILHGLRAGAVLLLLVPVFNLFALNRVRKDDNLVRSMNRLR